MENQASVQDKNNLISMTKKSENKFHVVSAFVIALIAILMLIVAFHSYKKGISPLQFVENMYYKAKGYVFPVPAPVIRDDIKAYVVADIDDSNDQTLYYVLRFYDKYNQRLSGQIAVATSSVAVDDNGTMSIQIIDDVHTATGTVYTSALINDYNIDQTDIPVSPIHIGDPCILYLRVIVCHAISLDIDTSVYGTTTAPQTSKSTSTKSTTVKGVSFSIAPVKMILADAPYQDVRSRQPSNPPPTAKPPQNKPPAAPKSKPPKSDPKPKNKPTPKSKPKPKPPATPPPSNPSGNPDGPQTPTTPDEQPPTTNPSGNPDGPQTPTDPTKPSGNPDGPQTPSTGPDDISPKPPAGDPYQPGDPVGNPDTPATQPDNYSPTYPAQNSPDAQPGDFPPPPDDVTPGPPAGDPYQPGDPQGPEHYDPNGGKVPTTPPPPPPQQRSLSRNDTPAPNKLDLNKDNPLIP